MAGRRCRVALRTGWRYSSTTAWVFPAIIDTTVAVSTLMLVALGGG
jgi:hypothetical protein